MLTHPEKTVARQSGHEATQTGCIDALEVARNPSRFDAKAQRTAKEHINRYCFAKSFIKNKKIIDASCGTGYGSEIFNEAGFSQYIGIDIDEGALSIAEGQHGAQPHTSFIKGDLAHMEMGSLGNSFDVFISFETVEHFPQYDHFLSFINSCLAPQGMLIISTPNRDVTNPGTTFSAKPVWEHHTQEWTLEEFTQLLQQHHFTIQHVYGQSFRFKHLFGRRFYGSRWLKKITQWPLPLKWLMCVAEPNFFVFVCTRDDV